MISRVARCLVLSLVPVVALAQTPLSSQGGGTAGGGAGPRQGFRAPAAAPGAPGTTLIDDASPAFRSAVPPAEGQIRPGIKLVSGPGVHVLYTRSLAGTRIVFPSADPIRAFSLGDRIGFRAVRIDNQIEVQPAVDMDQIVDTSLSVTMRSGRSYVFWLYSTETSTRRPIDVMVCVDVFTPCDPSLGLVAQATGQEPPGTVAQGLPLAPTNVPRGGDPAQPDRERGDHVRRIPFDPRVSHTDWRAFGPESARAILPRRIWDDGTWIYLDFGNVIDQGRIPAPFVVIDGVDQPIAPSMIGDRGHIMVVRRLVEMVTLRSGQTVLCLVRGAPVTTGPSVVPLEAPTALPSSRERAAPVRELLPGSPDPGTRPSRPGTPSRAGEG